MTSMTQTPNSADRPPLGSWTLTYALVALAAMLVMAVLWWFTAAFNVEPVAR